MATGLAGRPMVSGAQGLWFRILLAIGLLGGLLLLWTPGSWLLRRIDDGKLKLIAVLIGVALTIGLFLHPV